MVQRFSASVFHSNLRRVQTKTGPCQPRKISFAYCSKRCLSRSTIGLQKGEGQENEVEGGPGRLATSEPIPEKSPDTDQAWSPLFNPKKWLSNTITRPQGEERREEGREGEEGGEKEELECLAATQSTINNSSNLGKGWSILFNPQAIKVGKGSTLLQQLRITRITISKVPLVVLLVTQAGIGLVDEESSFIGRLLHKLFKITNNSPEIDVLVAVVDKLPYPTQCLSNEPHGFFKRAGFEGISVCVLNSEAAAPDLWSPREWPSERETMTIQQRCSLSFKFQPNAIASVMSRGLKHPRRLVSRELELPVANTLFQNGQTSTLFAERWKFTKSPESEPEILRIRKVLLPQQSIQMTGIYAATDLQSQFGLDIKLTSTTRSSIVADAMGNIIRKLQQGPGEIVPASKELEDVVSRLIETGEGVKKIDVWALVTPRESRITQPQSLPLDLHSRIERGSRLHRVLSGGGGWGIKAGLLALEPDSTYSRLEVKELSNFGEGQDVAMEKFQALGEVVKPGDLIEFFRFLDNEYYKLPPKITGKPGSWLIATDPSVSFGTVPSRMDDPSSTDEHSGQSRLPFQYIFIKNHFGMLSEHGMSFKVDTYSPDCLTSHAITEPLGPVVQTKLDPPYTMFTMKTGLRTSITRVLDKKNSAKEVSVK